MIEIVNLHGRKLAADEVYIGRKSRDLQGSPLGNPFPVRMGGREECIRKYRIWLWAQMQDPASDVSIELHRLVKIYKAGDLKLACWCHPLPCHGDVVAMAIRWLASKEGARE